MSNIVLAGGSGQVGAVLTRDFLERGHRVVILSRGAPRKEGQLEYVHWDGATLGTWKNHIDGSSVVINLAGRSVNCRYNQNNRREIFESRVNTTRVLGEAIAQAKQPPHVWLQSATATIYAHRYDAANDETTGIIGGNEPGAPDTWNFSIDVAKAWEATFDQAVTPHTRKVALRSAMVMSPDKGGVFDVLSGLARVGLGGAMGDGQQFVSWVHDLDFIRSIHFLLEHEEISGAINIASPNPLPNKEFMSMLRGAVGSRFGLPSANWMLEIGAFFLQTETELVLKSRRVVPQRLLEAGFVFEQPDWNRAARDLAQRLKR